jgi:hypothetical protein
MGWAGFLVFELDLFLYTSRVGHCYLFYSALKTVQREFPRAAAPASSCFAPSPPSGRRCCCCEAWCHHPRPCRSSSFVADVASQTLTSQSVSPWVVCYVFYFMPISDCWSSGRGGIWKGAGFPTCIILQFGLEFGITSMRGIEGHKCFVSC